MSNPEESIVRLSTILILVTIGSSIAASELKIQTKENQHQKILIFAPHPDDDIIGCGGSIAKHKQNGHEVTIVFMTSGEACGDKQPKNEIARMREQEATNAARILGVTKLHFLRNPDGHLADNQQNIIALVDLIRLERPDIVYAPHALDTQKDHKTTHKFVIEAIKNAASDSSRDYTGDPWDVQTVLWYEVWTPMPTVFYSEDISEFMQLKLKALHEHASQLSILKYDDAIEGLNRYRGAMKRTGYCEAFQIYKMNDKEFPSLMQK